MHSNFWLDSFNPASANDLYKLKISISNFVRILTGKSIPVVYEGTQSLTDGSTVILSGDIDVNNIDVTVGLALHEASHIMISNFIFIQNLSDAIPESLYELAERKLKINTKSTYTILRDLLNWIEDRRCDYYVISRLPGYREYYNSIYNKYFNTNEISALLLSTEYTSETIDSYMFRIFNMFNADSSENELIGLPEICKILDIEHINRLSSTSDSFEVACRIFIKLTELCIPDSDINYITNKDIIEQRKFINNSIKKIPIPLDVNYSLRDIKDINDINSSIVMVGDDVPCILLRNITDDVFYSDSFIFSDKCKQNIYLKEVMLGNSLGLQLANKLNIRNENRETIYTNKKCGYIDTELLYSAPFNDKIFYQTDTETHPNVMLHISLDLSDSMTESNKINTIIISTVAIARAIEDLNGVDLQISLRGTSYKNVYATIVYDSSVGDKFSKILRLFPNLHVSGGTPEGLCYEALIKYMIESSDMLHSYFINYSDGEPTYKNCIAHTREQMHNIRNKGINVMSYLIGCDAKSMFDSTIKNNFIQMYGKDAEFIDVSDIISLSRSINMKILLD